MKTFDTIVIGGGTVGSAIAYGIAKQEGTVALLDEGDVAVRASRGNFALVWLQGKGDGNPRYAAWSRQSCDIWPEFASELRERTGIDVGYSKPGGLSFCFTPEDLEFRRRLLERLKANAEPPGYDYEILDRPALASRLPVVGEDLAGATYCPHDGHCSSLFLLRALHAAFIAAGGRYLSNHRVSAIRPSADSFTVVAGADTLSCGRLVIAAGHGSVGLAPQVGLSVPVKPNRGQVLVTERFAPLIPFPTNIVRQTREGTIMIGNSKEDVGFDDRSVPTVMAHMAANAARALPFLRTARVVRAWSCLRIMPPDGFAIYDRSRTHPNAYAVSCHSGVTLAAVHATLLAPWIVGGALPERIRCFSADRFAVRKAA